MATAVATTLPNNPPGPPGRSAGPTKIDAKSLGVWGISTVVAGNLATLLGSFSTINEQVQKIQKQLNLGAAPYLLYLILAVIAGGYLLSFTSLYVWIKHKTAAFRPRRSVAVALVIFAGGITVAALNIGLYKDRVEPVLKGRIPLWSDKITNARNGNGGFSIMIDPGPSNPSQVLTSAQAITAVESAMDWSNPKQNELNAIRESLQYIDAKRSPAEGCWGYFDNSQPLTEVCAWVIIARTRALEHGDKVWPAAHQRSAQLKLLEEDLESMSQHYDRQLSGWSPFRVLQPNGGATHAAEGGQCLSISPDLEAIATLPPTRTYSSIMAVWALVEVNRVPQVRDALSGKYDQMTRESIGGLLKDYRSDLHGWVPNPHRANQHEEYLGLTAQTITVLYVASQSDFKTAVDQPAWKQIRHDFLANELSHHLAGDNAHLSDVDGYVFPYVHPLEPITFLWSPWTVLAYEQLSQDPELSSQDRGTARKKMQGVLHNYTPDFFERLESGPTYELAENLLCMSTAFR